MLSPWHLHGQCDAYYLPVMLPTSSDAIMTTCINRKEGGGEWSGGIREVEVEWGQGQGRKPSGRRQEEGGSTSSSHPTHFLCIPPLPYLILSIALPPAMPCALPVLCTAWLLRFVFTTALPSCGLPSAFCLMLHTIPAAAHCCFLSPLPVSSPIALLTFCASFWHLYYLCVYARLPAMRG